MYCKVVCIALIVSALSFHVQDVTSSDVISSNVTTTQPPTTAVPPTTPPSSSAVPTSTLKPTTTAAPPTTSTNPPTTSSSPSPPPAPTPAGKRGNWTVSDGNITCIMAQMTVSVKISYPLSIPKQNGTVELPVPALAVASGSCDKDSQSLVLAWGSSNKVQTAFGLNTTTKVYFMSHITLTVVADPKIFINISADWEGKNLTFESNSIEFKTNVNQSYSCTLEQSLPLHFANSTNSDAILVLSQVQLQAFHREASAVFGEAQVCELDTPDIVPIVVGCALAGLVLFVLVLYLWGRRRSQARGYLSM